jgi:hypothetical protein
MRAGAQLHLAAFRPWTQKDAVAPGSSSIAEKVLVLHNADKPVEDRKFDFEFDAVHSRFVRRLDFVVPGELDGDQSNVEDQDHDVDKDEVSE